MIKVIGIYIQFLKFLITTPIFALQKCDDGVNGQGDRQKIPFIVIVCLLAMLSRVQS